MSQSRTELQPSAGHFHISLPWLSAVTGLMALLYLLAWTEPGVLQFYKIPDAWLRDDLKYALALAFALSMLWDVRRLQAQRVRQLEAFKRLDEQIRELWQTRKQLQLKAHVYSGQTDKLKMFISEKLLEFIEYDEKFLHFKSIAAEVRHNGVISFDKIQNALKKAEEQQSDSRKTEYQDAQAALRYLWDLLDLSTADNLSLHIGNHLCECEEHYYQTLLCADQANLLLHEPVYRPQLAAWRALSLVRESTPALLAGKSFLLKDNQWRVRLDPVSDLLGNENHLVLLLENLLKNAQFFAGKQGYNSAFSRIAFSLTEEDGQARIRLYNRGPHIDEDEQQNLFKLGYSTRRVREHHGHGLGLYFLNEIVKGYEGRIRVSNIKTQEQHFQVRIELISGRVINEAVQVVVEKGQPAVLTQRGETQPHYHWALDEPLSSLEIAASNSQNTQRVSTFADRGKQQRFDPEHPETPYWQVTYQPRRDSSELTFEPLNINGVMFEVTLPTAEYRLKHSDVEQDSDLDEEVEKFDEHFRDRNPDY